MTSVTPVLVALALLQVTGPTGARIDVNTEAITSIRDPRSIEGHWTAAVHCVIGLSNGKLVAVRETCDEVRAGLGERTGPCTTVCGQSPSH